jgi:hypothetical protein
VWHVWQSQQILLSHCYNSPCIYYTKCKSVGQKAGWNFMLTRVWIMSEGRRERMEKVFFFHYRKIRGASREHREWWGRNYRGKRLCAVFRLRRRYECLDTGKSQLQVVLAFSIMSRDMTCHHYCRHCKKK